MQKLTPAQDKPEFSFTEFPAALLPPALLQVPGLCSAPPEPLSPAGGMAELGTPWPWWGAVWQ